MIDYLWKIRDDLCEGEAFEIIEGGRYLVKIYVSVFNKKDGTFHGDYENYVPEIKLKTWKERHPGQIIFPSPELRTMFEDIVT